MKVGGGGGVWGENVEGVVKNSFIQHFNLPISNHLYGVYTLYGEAILLFNGEKKRIMGGRGRKNIHVEGLDKNLKVL